MTVVEKINKQLAEFNEKRAALVKELQKDFPAMFAPLFEKSKLINSIGWTQYTPYFNDGDECVFGVRQDDLYVNGEYQDEVSWLDWRIKYYLSIGEYKNEIESNEEINIDEYKIVEEFKEVLQSVPESFYKDLFGDHMKVTINRDGTIETEEYEHD